MSNQNLIGKITLRDETVLFGGMLLRYRLLLSEGAEERFSVRISKGEEATETGVGNEISAALDCYFALLRGRVTPCALPDIMCDWNRNA